jgi:hypothetical protein
MREHKPPLAQNQRGLWLKEAPGIAIPKTLKLLQDCGHRLAAPTSRGQERLAVDQ